MSSLKTYSLRSSPRFRPYIPKALTKGKKASARLKGSFQAPNKGERRITIGSYVPGACQDFELHRRKPQTSSHVLIPCSITQLEKDEFISLLEAQRIEYLLVDLIEDTSGDSSRYYTQLLMAQRLQRAELEVELYREAIVKDGLPLLPGMRKFIMNCKTSNKKMDEDADEGVKEDGDESDGPKSSG